MEAYSRVYDSRHLQVDCQELGSAPEPYAQQSSTGYLLCHPPPNLVPATSRSHPAPPSELTAFPHTLWLMSPISLIRISDITISISTIRITDIINCE